MTRPPAVGLDRDAAAERDEQLAALLLQLTDAAQRGESPNFEAVAKSHPSLVAELRELWGAVMIADAVAARVGASNADIAQAREPEPPLAGLVPPRSSIASAGEPRGGFAATGSIPTGSVGSASLPAITRSSAAAAPTVRFGDYELLAEIGRGGMGIVYQARQTSLDRVVAIKMMLRGERATPSEQFRFRAEAEAAARLAHPNIVPVYEVGDLDGQPYFSMKLVEGVTLSRRLADGPLGGREAAALLAPICRAIQFAHEQGVLHRDLKPSNILIDEVGRPHVTDFGLAKRIDEDFGLTHTGAILGTPAYMAPEQAAGNRGQIGPTSDVYSLGTILYQMLTGRPPFQAASPVDTVLLVLEQDPLPPHLLNAKADRDLEMIALRALQKPQELRYPTAAALASDLEAYLAGEPISARSGGFSQVIARLFRETHHATILENWGLLWMWHSAVLLLLCLVTNWLAWRHVPSRWPYALLWSGGLAIWAPIFWALRRRAGPVTFIERQIAHVWGASVLSSISLFVVEMLIPLPVLTLSPVLGLMSGMVFVVKAGILSGAFYLQAAVLFATAAAMAVWPSVGLTLFGIVSAGCFFFPGLKYYRQSKLSEPVVSA